MLSRDYLRTRTQCVDLANPNLRGLPSTYKGYYYVGTSDCGSASSRYTRRTKPSPATAPTAIRDIERGRTGFMFALLVDGGSERATLLELLLPRRGDWKPDSRHIAYQTVLARCPQLHLPRGPGAWVAAAEDLYGPYSQNPTGRWNPSRRPGTPSASRARRRDAFQSPNPTQRTSRPGLPPSPERHATL
jgi:hypothetical protein